MLDRGRACAITLDNALTEPTIAHWHGLAVDTANDGNGMTLVAPGERYDYDFEVRNRGGLYWYHPHPHGTTAAQAYRGLFGIIDVEDDDERRLRAALALVPGETEIPLVLQDRRPNRYAIRAAPRRLLPAFWAMTCCVNGTECPYLDVATRIYRFRVLNASNARTFRLAFRRNAVRQLPFSLIGTDGGLLPAPLRARKRSSHPPNASTCWSTSPTRRRRHRAARDPRIRSDAWRCRHECAADADRREPRPSPRHPPVDMPRRASRQASPKARRCAAAIARTRARDLRRTVPAGLSPMPALPSATTHERPLRLGFAKGRWRINDRVFVDGRNADRGRSAARWKRG